MLSLPIFDIVELLVNLRDRNLLEQADYWFTRKLDEIESELEKPLMFDGKEQEKSEYWFASKRSELEIKHFGIELYTLRPEEKLDDK